MRKKLWISLALLFVIPGLLFTVSCAKKTVKEDTAVQEQQAEEDARIQAREAEQMERQRRMEEERLQEQEAMKCKNVRIIFIPTLSGFQDKSAPHL